MSVIVMFSNSHKNFHKNSPKYYGAIVVSSFTSCIIHKWRFNSYICNVTFEHEL